MQEEYTRLDKELDDLKERLLDVKEIKELDVKVNLARKAAEKERKDILKKVQKVRQRFLVNGPTPAIIKALNELIDEVNGDA